MTVPRDFHADARTGWIRISRHFSNIVSPPTIFAVLGLVLAYYEQPNLTGILWGVAHGLFVTLTPILFILWMLRTGRIAELHMTNQQERYLPYLVTIGCATIFTIVTSLLGGPELLACLSAINGVTVLILAIINIYWLISIHATSAMAMAAICYTVFSPLTGFLLFLLVIAVAANRVYLKRHTVGQVVGGVLCGAIIVWLFTLFGCFLP